MRNFLAIISMCALLLSAGCSDSDHEEKEEKVVFTATSPLKKDTLINRDYVCQIRAIQHIEIRALEKGYLEHIYVDEGQLVHKGQLMFKIMPVIYDAELKKSEAEADFAKIEYENTKNLFDKNVVSSAQLALAKAKYDKALADVALAKAHLSFTEIRAPFDGIMDHFQVRLGSLVNEGDLLTTLSDNSKMWVYFNVPEAEYLTYKGQKSKDKMVVNLLMANNELFDSQGVVETIEADFNNETGNIAFRATFPNPEGLLRHGETGSIKMPVIMKNALIIPQKSTFEVLEKKYVFVIGKDNVVHAREITISAELPDIYIVKTGLAEGDRIMLEGIRKVKEGDKIEYTFKEPKAVINSLKVYVE